MINDLAWPRLLKLTGLLLISVLLLISCAPMEKEASKPDYKTTKQMVLDILRTEEGKKALQEVVAEKELKQSLLLDEPFVKMTIQETLLQPENKEKWQKLMHDPKFAKEYAKYLEDEHKKLLKTLMKDPEYQASMMEILQEPDMQKQFLKLTKSKEFRQETMNVFKEALESPYFRLELLQLLSKAAEDMQMKGEDEQGKKGEEKKDGKGK